MIAKNIFFPNGIRRVNQNKEIRYGCTEQINGALMRFFSRFFTHQFISFFENETKAFTH